MWHRAAPEPSYCVLRGIAENLHRAELTALEYDQHLAEWIRLTEEAEAQKRAAAIPQTKEMDLEPARRGKPKKKPVQSEQVPKAKGGRGKKGGVSAATRELGVNRVDAVRALKVASLTLRGVA